MCKYAFRQSVVAVMLVLSLFAVAGAQEFRGALSGNVTDPNGATLPGATVELRNVETNVASTVVTNEEGGFSFPLLQPGMYTLSVTTQGFTTARREGIEIRVADRLPLGVRMQAREPGAAGVVGSGDRRE